MKIGLVANSRKEQARAMVARVREVFKPVGARIVLEQETAEMMGETADEFFAKDADFVLSLGGDGTLLETLSRMEGECVPVAGVNIGTLGFLTTCQDDQLEEFAKVVAEGRHMIVERTMLSVTMVPENCDEMKTLTAVNEVVIARGETGRMVALKAVVDGELLNDYKADGLILSTPTGSTAYSLSAGGPLIGPRAGVFVLTPICPHSLSNRSLVVDDGSEVEIIASGQEPVLFTVDGRESERIHPETIVTVRKALNPLLLVRMPGHSFYETLRKKLHWHGG